MDAIDWTHVQERARDILHDHATRRYTPVRTARGAARLAILGAGTIFLLVGAVAG